MGAIQSMQEALRTAEEVSAPAAEPTSDSTPVRPVNKRLLQFDPRSPSEGIDRTPINVERTPGPGNDRNPSSQTLTPSGDPRSPTLEFTRTPVVPGQRATGSPTACGNKMSAFDPRSPTVEFTRTPLVPGRSAASPTGSRHKTSTEGVADPQSPPTLDPDMASASPSLCSSKVCSDTALDPRSPSQEFTRTPLNPAGVEKVSVCVRQTLPESPTSVTTGGSESGIESAEVTPVKNLALELSAESPDSAFSVCTQKDSSTAGSDGVSISSMGSRQSINELTPKLQAVHSVSTGRPLALSKLSEQYVAPGSDRSPLAFVGNNTTQGVAGKGVGSRIPKLRRRDVPSSGNRDIIDKENCTH